MIGALKGRVIEKKPPGLLLDVHGVGYEIQVSMTTFYQLPEMGEDIFLYTHLAVREDAQLLYGFHTVQERLIFRELIKVSGVGPKLALAILSGMDPQTFGRCVEEKDTSRLVKLPGVGKKTAERLIIEMRDRLAKRLSDTQAFSDILLATPNEKSVQHSARQDAISALMTLGYKQAEAVRVIDKLQTSPEQGSEALIRLALTELSKS